MFPICHGTISPELPLYTCSAANCCQEISGYSPRKMQSKSRNCAKIFSKADGSGAKDLSVDPSTFGFPQDANQKFSNRALQFGRTISRQGFEDKDFLASGPDFVLNGASAAHGEYQQFDHFLRPCQPVESDEMQVQYNDRNIAHYSKPSNASCLDHVEELTFYDHDGYDDRALSFRSSHSTEIVSYPYSSPLQSNNCIADTQDGTWTALKQMQEALEASNEECSDLTFSNAELSGGNTMQHQVVWDNDCLTSPSFTSNFLPFPGEVEATLTNTMQNFVDLPHDNGQDISSFEPAVPEQNGPTTSHVYQHQDAICYAQWRTNPSHEESSGLMPVTQDRQNNISHQQFNSFVNAVDGSVDSGMTKLHGLYDCEEQMEIDSLLNSFGASSDTFSQTCEIFQKGENYVDLDKKVKLEETISATRVSNVSYTAQAGATESIVSDGSFCPQQYQTTSQSCGLFYSSQWKTMSSSAFPLWGCQNGIGHSNSMISFGTDGKDHLLYADHTSVQQQQSAASDTKLELIDNVANPYQEFTADVDSQCHGGALGTQAVWAVDPHLMESCIFGLHSSTHTGHLDMKLPVTHANHVQLPAPRLSKDPNSSSIEGTELKKADEHHSDMQLPRTQTTHDRLPAPSLYKKPELSFIGGTELKKVDKHHPDMQLPGTQANVKLPVPRVSKDANLSFIGGTELKEADQVDDCSHIGSPQQSILFATSKPSHSSGLPIEKLDGGPKKRKRSTTKLLASHAQVMSGYGRMQCRRTPGLDWIGAIKRLAEKVDGENATMDNKTIVSRAQERLALTSSLIQYVLPVLPPGLLAANVTDSGETIVYHICKLALGDTFCPVSSLVNDTNNFAQSGNMPRSETSTSGKEDCKIISEVLETFAVRFSELESSLSRAEKIPTLQDWASELRAIERWSICHHLAKLQAYKKHHAGNASSPWPNPCTTTLQKQAGDTAASMPVDLLRGIRCRLLK